MSESRSLTLRKKKGNRRPQISSPQQTSGAATKPGVNGTASTLSEGREKGQQSETSDIVKRRYSTRFNQLPDFSSGAPSVPGLPSHLKRSSQEAPPRRQGGSPNPLRVNVNALNDPNLQPEKYVTDLLSNATEGDIQDYQNNLRKIKNRNSTDLQQNVYKNRTQFIEISREAEKLKSEMVTLQALMSELTGTLGHAVPVEDTLSRKKTNRSSVANLESMWNTQLQELHKHIEGSQTFLPAIAGRHVVMETGHWIELDSATWKARRPVHIVLLNDHLLVASIKRKRIDPNNPNLRGPAPTKLVAEQCWPLQDIDIVDLGANVMGADDRKIGPAVTVRTGGKSFTYKHDQRDERRSQEKFMRDEKAKNDLLTQFRKTAEDLRKTILAETEKSAPPKDPLNFIATRDPAVAKKPDIIEGIIAARDQQPEILFDVDGKQQNLRWVEGQIDDLDIDIALQRFEQAVDRVESLRKVAKGLKGSNIAQDLILVKLDERAAKLATILTRALVDTPSYLEATKTNVSYLTRLGYEDQAREGYLSARSDALAKRARQCVFEGDLHKYIFQISYIYFTIIKNTVGIYQACFAPLMMSACIKWAKGHLDIFNAILVRQLSATEKGGTVWKECVELVMRQERQMLGDVGLDFREVVTHGLDVRDLEKNERTFRV